eukprot:g5371.t1
MDHVVLLRVSKDATEKQKAQMVDAIKSLCEIEGVETVTAGQSFTSARAGGYNYALRVRMKDKKYLKTYATDPKHVYVRDTFIAPILDKSSERSSAILAVDYETEEVSLNGAASSVGIGSVAAAFLFGALLGISVSKFSSRL